MNFNSLLQGLFHVEHICVFASNIPVSFRV